MEKVATENLSWFFVGDCARRRKGWLDVIRLIVMLHVIMTIVDESTLYSRWTASILDSISRCQLQLDLQAGLLALHLLDFLLNKLEEWVALLKASDVFGCLSRAQ